MDGLNADNLAMQQQVAMRSLNASIDEAPTDGGEDGGRKGGQVMRSE